MRFLSEDTLAMEVAEMIKDGFDYNERVGCMPFSLNVEVDTNEQVYVEGSLTYSIGYEEDVNYVYISSASVRIDEVRAYDNDGDEVECHYNISRVEEYVADYLIE